ncbi:hypothetical protein [Brevundimonas sp. FT23028]|uniref:hypothetical protein n=1 Tax=Brevundimonas sp. FT23028 TaxID=3393748 RepID=UPI003B589641
MVKIIQQINTNVENQTHKTELLSLKLDSMDKDLKDFKKDLREDIDRVDKKAEDAMHVAEKVKEKILIWSGGIAAVMAVGCIIWIVYSQMKQDNDKLEERLRKYEINQGINYGRQQGSK